MLLTCGVKSPAATPLKHVADALGGLLYYATGRGLLRQLSVYRCHIGKDFIQLLALQAPPFFIASGSIPGGR